MRRKDRPPSGSHNTRLCRGMAAEATTAAPKRTPIACTPSMPDAVRASSTAAARSSFQASARSVPAGAGSESPVPDQLNRTATKPRRAASTAITRSAVGHERLVRERSGDDDGAPHLPVVGSMHPALERPPRAAEPGLLAERRHARPERGARTPVGQPSSA